MLNIEKALCTGCEVCVSVCPVQAIKMEPSEKGFLYPKIDSNICIHCGLCDKKCPININTCKNDYGQQVYAAWSNDDAIRVASSSGGIFTVLSRYVFSKNGVVCASCFTEDFMGVHFDLCDNETDLARFRGSKYVQSTSGKIYQKVKETLNDKRLVLYVGTGCQVAGLKAFLGKDYENLICVDLVCHGVPSPMVWENYVKGLIDRYDGNTITDISFRKKKPSWKEYSLCVKFSNGKKYEAIKTEDSYMIAFGKDIMLRQSCENCKYACLDREGDITLSDFWAYRSFNYKTRNKEKGISCVIINTDKGHFYFEAIRSYLTVVDKNIDEAIRGNRSLVHPWPANVDSDKFWKLYFERQNEALLSFCTPYKISRKMKIDWFIQDYLWMIPKPILKKILNRRK